MDHLHLPSSFLSPKLEARPVPEKGGMGIFALEPIAQGELVAAWGGTIVPAALLDQLSEKIVSLSLQVEDELYLVPDRLGPGDYVNHSCDPNGGISGTSHLVAMRDIAPGEEVTFDYAMGDATPYDSFECACGSPICRGTVTGNDWMLPALWDKYAGYFSPYIQRRIDRLRQQR